MELCLVHSPAYLLPHLTSAPFNVITFLLLSLSQSYEHTAWLFFFTCSHALPCEKTQGTVCAPRQTPYVRFNARPPHEGHVVHSVYSDTRQFIEADGRGFMVKYVKLHFEQCRWIPAARTVVWVQCCTEPLLSEWQTVCSENRSHYCWRCLSCEQDKTQDKTGLRCRRGETHMCRNSWLFI